MSQGHPQSQPRMPLPCSGDPCRLTKVGHGVEMLQSLLAADEENYPFQPATVRLVSGLEVILEDAAGHTATFWHHRDLADRLPPGSTVEVSIFSILRFPDPLISRDFGIVPVTMISACRVSGGLLLHLGNGAIPFFERSPEPLRMADDIPWTVAPEHSDGYQHQMLQIAQRLRKGEKVGKSNQSDFSTWLTHLYEADAVVHYDPSTELGWFYVPRRAGIDRDLIREPGA